MPVEADVTANESVGQNLGAAVVSRSVVVRPSAGPRDGSLGKAMFRKKQHIEMVRRVKMTIDHTSVTSQ